MQEPNIKQKDTKTDKKAEKKAQKKAQASFKTKLTGAQKRKDILVLGGIFAFLYILTILVIFGTSGLNVFDEMTNISSAIFTILLFTIGIPLISLFALGALIFPVIIAAAIFGAQKGRGKRVRDAAMYTATQGIDYYRDNLSQLNPALVSLLMDLDIYGEKDIAATLLRMHNKGGRELDQSEKELLELEGRGMLNNEVALSRWRENRFKEAEELGYIQKKTLKDRQEVVNFYKKLTIFATAITPFLIFYSIINHDFTTTMLFIYVADAVLAVLWYRFMREANYRKRGDVLWERTPLGNEMAEKIAGLARFIQEYSDLSQAEKEHVRLWDDYLVYALVLEDNEKVVKEMCEQYGISLRGKRRFREPKSKNKPIEIKLSAILLAAGQSKRMGNDKLMLIYRNGRTLLELAYWSVNRMPVYEKIVVCTAQRQSQLFPLEGVSVCINENPEEGMSGSVRIGVQNATGTHYLFLNADQPELEWRDIAMMRDLAMRNPDKIIHPVIGNMPCSPVIFPATFREELLSLTGDTGGRVIRDAHPEACFGFYPPNPKKFKDIDTLNSWMNRFKEPKVD